MIRQVIEGFNVADLGWGSADAQTVTLSFWVRSSVTGTFGGAVQNASENRAYAFTYSIAVANTWEKKTITIPGDTTGTWAKDNTQGMIINWSLGVGTTYSSTANSWAAQSSFSATGSTALLNTLNATFYITGVQLEAGTVATPFERRSYGHELSLCQRYCFRFGAIVGASGGHVYPRFPLGFAVSATEAYIIFEHPVPMRSQARSLVTTAPNGIEIITGGYVDTSFTTSLGSDTNTDTTTFIAFGSISTTASSVFVARFYNSASANFLVSAEL
jgi:hypothetical protein